jgi:hypothetical protein
MPTNHKPAYTCASGWRSLCPLVNSENPDFQHTAPIIAVGGVYLPGWPENCTVMFVVIE